MRYTVKNIPTLVPVRDQTRSVQKRNFNNNCDKFLLLLVLDELLESKDMDFYLQKLLYGDLDISKGILKLFPELTDQDRTSAVFNSERITLKVITKEDGILSGIKPFLEVFKLLDPEIFIEFYEEEGVFIEKEEQIAIITGNSKAIFIGRKLAINLLSHLSAIATKSRQFTDSIRYSMTKIVDTPNTTPGLGKWEEEAIIHGGGINHRYSLYDQIYIKSNHQDFVEGGLTILVQSLRHKWGNNYPLIIEVRNLEELIEAKSLRPTRINLQNFSLDELYQAVDIVNGEVSLEASGNISLENAQKIAKTGVDFISIDNELTSNIQTINFTLEK